MLQWLDTIIGMVVVLLATSLIVMLLTQIISTFRNLRGDNLRKGLIILFENTNVDLKKHAEELSDKILRHELITDRWNIKTRKRDGLASSITPGELKNILEVLAKSDLVPDDLKQSINDSIDDIKAEIDLWFDSTMDRATQFFIMNTRVVTIFISLLVAFFLQLNAFDIFEQISTDKELRASLVASSQTFIQKSDDYFGSSGTTNLPEVYSSAILQLSQKEPNIEGLKDPPTFNSREEAKNWLQKQIKKENKIEDENELNRYLDLYNSAVNSKLNSSISTLKDTANSIRAEMDKTKFKLIPDPYYFPFEKDKISEFYPNKRKFWGILAMAGLLSLGAPFWFNVLKSLSSLRPIIAGKDDKRREEKASE